MRRLFIATVTAVWFLTFGATPVLAHVTISPQEAPADGHARLTLRISHGCAGSPTTEIAIQIREGVVSVKPELVAGWEYETVVGELSESASLHGEEITEGVREVRWFGGPPIPDDAFQEFGLSVRLPDAPEETLYFPVLQTCEEGEHAWIERPAEGQSAHELEEPAPALTLTTGGNGDSHGKSHGDSGDAHTDDGGVAEPTVSSAEVSDARKTASQARVLAIVALVAAVALGGAALLIARR